MLRRDKSHIQTNLIKDERTKANIALVWLNWEKTEIRNDKDEIEKNWKDEIQQKDSDPLNTIHYSYK